MTWRKRTIMEMAEEAGMLQRHNSGYDIWIPEYLQAFVALVREEATAEANARANASWTLMCEKMVAIEREACAKVCEDIGRAEEMQAIGNDYAEAIRARGQA